MAGSGLDVMEEVVTVGRAKKKKKSSIRKRMINRNSIRLKMGKPVFFTLTHCSKKLRGISNKYNYKANMHNLCFVGARFYNVKYQASIMTDCNYRNSDFLGVDFFNCNMRGTSFKSAKLKNVVFYNCNLKGADFSEATFDDVIFICTNMNAAINLNPDTPGITILRTYKALVLSEAIKTALLNLSQNKSVFNARVLHVNQNKLNHWTLGLIHQKYGDDGIEKLSNILYKKEDWDNLYTVFSYMLLIENWNKK